MDTHSSIFLRSTRRAAVAAASITLAAIMTFGMQPSIAQMVTVVDAVELSASNIILPRTTHGMVTFRACAGECDEEFRRARLTPETRFFVGARAVDYSDFQARFAGVRYDDTSYALVSVDTKTITVTSILIEE